MNRFRFSRLYVVAIILFSIWSGAAALDPDESGSGHGASDFPRYHGQDYSTPNLKSDLEPYVGDQPLIDSLYKVGPGDLFQIFFESSAVEKQVNSEGNIILNRMGVIHLGGLTLKEAKNLILNNLQTTYKRSECFVNLSRPKTMRIFVTGGVNAPGTYQVPGNFRLSDAIQIASGFSILAQKEAIQIQSGDGSTENVSIQNFMLNGDIGSNPYLTQGCIIHVPFIDYNKPWVTVLRDSTSYIVQLETGETVQDAILKTHSFYPPAPFSAVLVREKDGRDTLLTPGDAITYHPHPEANIEMLSPKLGVYVAGAVATPGPQTYRSDRKIIQYISSAGLLSSTKVEDQMEVFRKSGQREWVSSQDVLRPGDIIYVRQNFEQKFLIYTPILLSLVSLVLALLTIKAL